MCLFPVVTVSLYSPMTHNVCFDDCFFKQLEGEQNPFSKRFKQCMAPTFAASSGGFWSRQILSAFIGSKVVSINQVDLAEILSHWHVQYMSLIPVYMSSVYLACSLPAFDLCATCKRPLLIWAVPPWKWRGAHWDGHAVWLPPGPAIYIYIYYVWEYVEFQEVNVYKHVAFHLGYCFAIRAIFLECLNV